MKRSDSSSFWGFTCKEYHPFPWWFDLRWARFILRSISNTFIRRVDQAASVLQVWGWWWSASKWCTAVVPIVAHRCPPPAKEPSWAKWRMAAFQRHSGMNFLCSHVLNHVTAILLTKTMNTSLYEHACAHTHTQRHTHGVGRMHQNSNSALGPPSLSTESKSRLVGSLHLLALLTC